MMITLNIIGIVCGILLLTATMNAIVHWIRVKRTLWYAGWCSIPLLIGVSYFLVLLCVEGWKMI